MVVAVYLSRRNERLRLAESGASGVVARGERQVSSNVVFLGLTSMFTDISSEMVTAVLPVYLTFQLRFTPLQFGTFDGLYQSLAAVVLVAGALVADSRKRHKEVAGLGYALSAGCKLGLLASGGAWLPTVTSLYVDRTGKGMRTAPRDALISLSSAPARLARSFGVHRALDTAGAVLGPVVAFVILAVATRAYDAVFLTSFCAAIIGLGMLVLFVENRRGRELDVGSASRRVSLRAAFRLLSIPGFRALVVVGAVLSVLSVSDAFVYLTFQRRASLGLGFFPLLYVGTSVVYLILAVPLGRLADRVARDRVFVGGHVLLLGVYLVLLLPGRGVVAMLGLWTLFGAYYAATDGVLMALASSQVPPGLRASGLALLTTATALGRLVASIAFGLFWSWRGSGFTVTVFAIALAVVLPVVAAALFARHAPEPSAP